MRLVHKNNATVFLFLNAFLWGSSYVWSKMLLGYLPRFSILSICSFGGLIATLILFYPSIRTINIHTAALSIGVTMFSVLSNTFFMLALQHTSSSNAAFIVQLSVIITPLIMALAEKRVPAKRGVLSALIAVLGLFMLTCNIRNFHLNIGDLFALGNALFFSLFLVSLNMISKKVNPVQFTIVHHATNTIFFLVMAGLLEVNLISFEKLRSPVFALLIGASICVTVITVLVQSTTIRFVRPEKATLVYTFEPVTAMFLAFIFIGEKFNGIGPVIGCALIILSVFYSLYRPKAKQQSVKSGAASKPVLE